MKNEIIFIVLWVHTNWFFSDFILNEKYIIRIYTLTRLVLTKDKEK